MTEPDKSKKSDPLRTEIEHRKDELRRLADEVRLKIHLGGMDAKDAWKRLEPRIDEFERSAGEITEDIGKELKQMGKTLKADLQKLRDRMAQGSGKSA